MGDAVAWGADDAEVGGWATLVRALPTGPVALVEDDLATFTAALLGAWHAGRTVVLPADALPGTRGRVGPEVHWIGGGVGVAPPIPRAGPPPAVPLDPAHARLTLFTSGSTGDPVAQHKTLATLLAEVDALEAAFGAHLGGARIVGTVPHHHIYGLLFRVLWPLRAGRPSHAPRLTLPHELAATLAVGPAVLVSSPAHLSRLPDDADWSGARETLRIVFSSGGPLLPDGAAHAQRLLGVTPTEVFGSTETGGIAWRRGGTAWTPLPGVAVALDDGQLAVTSPWADGGHVRTQDRADPTPEGGFRLLGRADRIVKVEEKRVSLTAIERHAVATGLVLDARATVLPLRRATVAVAVVPSPTGRALLVAEGADALGHRLRAALAHDIDAVALPRRWRAVEVLPVDAVGKVTDAAVRALFLRDLPVARVRDVRDDTVVLAVDITPDLRALDGHFDGWPIVPGVALVDWAIRLARAHLPVAGAFTRLDQVKFRRVVQPGATLTLTLTWRASALTFAWAGDEGPHADGRVVFSA